jgi:hypothetical protein
VCIQIITSLLPVVPAFDAYVLGREHTWTFVILFRIQNNPQAGYVWAAAVLSCQTSIRNESELAERQPRSAKLKLIWYSKIVVTKHQPTYCKYCKYGTFRMAVWLQEPRVGLAVPQNLPECQLLDLRLFLYRGGII